MAVYKDIDGAEYSTELYITAFVIMLIMSVVLAGAVAGVVAFFAGAVPALVTWLTLSGAWTTFSAYGLHVVRKRSQKVS